MVIALHNTPTRLPQATANKPMAVNMKHASTIILSGGQGSRLFPLTTWRCKPAMSFGGRFKLIDVPISNAIHSGCKKIYIVTQFLSSSLHHHIFNTYRFDPFTQGFIELLTTEERPDKQTWFAGTADAVRQNIPYILETPADYFFILSGDQLYHMDFEEMLAQAIALDSSLMIATMPIGDKQSRRMGVMKINDLGYITHFHEKPQKQSELDALRHDWSRHETLQGFGDRTLLGSLGIYLFKKECLLDLLFSDMREDFGKHLIPTQVQQGGVAAYVHKGYWEDIGTIESYYEANIGLTQSPAPFDLMNEDFPIFSAPHNLPGPQIIRADIESCLLSEGCSLEEVTIRHSLVGPRTAIGPQTRIDSSYIMGNEQRHKHQSPVPEGQSSYTIGKNCVLKKCIIDQNVTIGNHVKLLNQRNLQVYDSPEAYVRDGIIVIPRGAQLPDGFTL